MVQDQNARSLGLDISIYVVRFIRAQAARIVASVNGVRCMDIGKIGKEVYQLQKKRVWELGNELTPELIFPHLSEEVGEIARQLVNKYLAIRQYEESNLKDEIVQAISDLFVLSEIYNIDLSEASARKIPEMAIRQKEPNHSKRIPRQD